jgi:hypothetical protein
MKKVKGKEFKRKSKGALEREARRYLQNKKGTVELVYKK